MFFEHDVGENGVGANRDDLHTEFLEFFVSVCDRRQFGRSDKGKIGQQLMPCPQVAVRVNCLNHMIHPYDNATQTRWDRGEFKVQLNLPNNPRPIGFCDGSPEDVAELLSIAETEGAIDVKIHKKHLKSGREVWTLGGPG